MSHAPPPPVLGLQSQLSSLGMDGSGKKTSGRGRPPLQKVNSAKHFEKLKPSVTAEVDDSILESHPEYEGLIAKYAQEGDLKMLKKAIKRNREEISAPEPGTEFTPLHFATKLGFFDCVKLLVEQGAEVNVVDYMEYSPLHNSVIIGHFEAVRFLVENGANIQISGEDVEVPLIYAASRGYFKIMKYLIAHGADVNTTGRWGAIPLIYASDGGHYDCVKYLLDNGSDQNHRDKDGHTALYRACVWGHTECVRILVKRGASTTVQDLEGRTALHEAARRGFVDCIKHLVADGGLSANIQDLNGNTALHVAADEDQFEVLKLLMSLDNKMDLNIKDEANRRFFELLSLSSREKLIVESNFSLNTLSKNNYELWFYIIQLDLEGVHKKVELYIEKYPQLAFAVDTQGRVGIDMATLPNKVAILLKSECPFSFLAQNNFEMWFYLIRMKEEDVDKRVFEYVQLYQDLAEATNFDGNSALHEATPDNRIAIILACRHPLVEIFDHQYEAWFQLIQCTDIEDVELVVCAYVEQFPELAYCKNMEGRLAIDCATPSIREAIRSIFLWHGRFDVLSKYPDYGSRDCIVFRAIDESELDDQGMPCQIALKLFHSKSKLMSLWDIARKDFEDKYVIPIIDSFPPPGYDLTSFPDDVSEVLTPSIYNGQELLKKVEAEKLYCCVMPFAEKNLFTSIKRDRLGYHATSDAFSKKMCIEAFTQIVEAVEHVHSRGHVHGNLVPVNIGRYEERWMLLDMCSSVAFGSPVMKGKKYSSAYVPPEAITVDEDGMYRVRSDIGHQGFSSDTKIDYLKAHPSFDIWALGCILFQLVSPTNSQLFSGDVDDNLVSTPADENSLCTLMNWSSSKCNLKLLTIQDSLAVNLLQSLLHSDPDRRPSASRVLAHPFLSNKSFSRLPFQKAEYDIYLSYRDCDIPCAKYLSQLLGDQGISVWWDKTSLLPNQSWLEGFSSGMVNSSIFVCLISRLAINSPDQAAHNFGSFTEKSSVDKMLLEFRMALELLRAGLIDMIVPIFIGDDISTTNGNFTEHSPETRTYGKYLTASLLPRAANVVVYSIEVALNECLNKECLGGSVLTSLTVADTLQRIVQFSGVMIEGDGFIAFKDAVGALTATVEEHKNKSSCTDAKTLSLFTLPTPTSSTPMTSINTNVNSTAVASPACNAVAPSVAEQVQHPVSTSGQSSGGQRGRRGSFQDGLRSMVKQPSFKGMSLDGKEREGPAQRSVLPTVAPPINESRRPSLNAEMLTQMIESSTIASLQKTIAEQSKELVCLQEQLAAMDQSKELSRLTDNESKHSGATIVNADAVKVSALQGEVDSLKVIIDAKNREIQELKEPNSKEMHLLKEQLALLSALEKEMKTMAEKNKILRKQANKEMKALRDQLTIQLEENLRLRQQLDLGGSGQFSSPMLGKKLLLPAIATPSIQNVANGAASGKKALRPESDDL